MIKEIAIKFSTELKPTKASWKSQLYNLEGNKHVAWAKLAKRPDKEF